MNPAELVIVCADHGGGGVTRTAHDSAHAFDTTVPVVLAGGSVIPGDLGPNVAFADIPATIVWSLGLPIPTTYAGHPLAHAFHRSELAA
jgi:phosphopentomutase